jgi:hypothetical protein
MTARRPKIPYGADKIPDDITLAELVKNAARVLSRAGLEHRIDIYREVDIDDPAVRMMLGRPHRVRVRLKITASSLLFEGQGEDDLDTVIANAPRIEP